MWRNMMCRISTRTCLLVDIGAVSVVICSVVMLTIQHNSLIVFVLIHQASGSLLAQPAIILLHKRLWHSRTPELAKWFCMWRTAFS